MKGACLPYSHLHACGRSKMQLMDTWSTGVDAVLDAFISLPDLPLCRGA